MSQAKESETYLEESAALHVRARAFIDAFVRGETAMPETFDALACDLARFQAEHAAGFARLCHARGIAPSAFVSASEIPPVPTDAFKLTRVATFDARSATSASIELKTSGTTIGARGTHAMRDPSTYDAGAVAFGRHWLARDLKPGTTMPVVVLAPPPSAMPDSSLGRMCAHFVAAFGEASTPSETWLIDGDVIDVGAFDMRVATALARQEPMLVLATSFALVHLLEALGEDTFALPQGSRVMQTGGYKGKSREIPADVLRRELARVFSIPERSIVSEYGMTELSSQFYEQTLFDPAAEHNRYAEPPWARVIPVDPETLSPVPDGELGIAKIIDLLNVDSAVAILTQDRVRRVGTSFELHGRAPGAPPRGCSIAIDELLGRSVN